MENDFAADYALITARIKKRIQKVQHDLTIYSDDCEYDMGVSESKKEELSFLESLLIQKD